MRMYLGMIVSVRGVVDVTLRRQSLLLAAMKTRHEESQMMSMFEVRVVTANEAGSRQRVEARGG